MQEKAHDRKQVIKSFKLHLYIAVFFFYGFQGTLIP